MKTTKILLLLTFGFSFAGYAQQTSETTGGGLSLESALDLFKNSRSPEDFEKALNFPNNSANNLDLNNDGQVDYIAVEDLKEGDTHAIVLSAWLNNEERQDVATIGIEKTGDAQAVLQIEGDPDVYADNTIFEPINENETLAPSKGGPSIPEIKSHLAIVNVWTWPAVRFLYGPTYVTWVSPYRWALYPKWYTPWHPLQHTVFYAKSAPNRVYYRPVTTRRVVLARKLYTPKRRTSTLVLRNNRGGAAIVKKTPVKTTVVRKNANGRVKSVKVKRRR